jgi:hypothetical protein
MFSATRIASFGGSARTAVETNSRRRHVIPHCRLTPLIIRSTILSASSQRRVL